MLFLLSKGIDAFYVGVDTFYMAIDIFYKFYTGIDAF